MSHKTWLKIAGVMVAVLFFGFFGVVEAASNTCCGYFSGSSLSDKCLLYNIDSTKTPPEVELVTDNLLKCDPEPGGTEVKLFDNSGTYTVNEGDVLIPENLFGSYIPISDKVECVDFPGNYLLKGGVSHPACYIGVHVLNEEKTDAERKQLFDTILDDLHKNYLDPLKEKMCCIPVEREDGGNCGQPEWLGFSVASLVANDVEALEGYDVENPDINKLSTLLTCEPGSSEWKDGWHLYEAKCDDVTGLMLPPSKVQSDWDEFKAEHPDANLGVKFTASAWCSTFDAEWLQYCACSSDKAKCKVEPFNEKSECEALLASEGSSYYGGTCHSFNNTTKEELGITGCIDFEKEPEKEKLDGSTDGFELLPTSGLNPLGATTVQQFIGRMISIAMGIIGSVALVIVIYGGAMWMTAAGNEEQSKNALQTLFWGGIGIGVILASYAIVRFVFQSFQ